MSVPSALCVTISRIRCRVAAVSARTGDQGASEGGDVVS